MMRLLPWSAAAAAACGLAFFVSSAGAQTSPKCGGESWSQSQMRYVTVPCTAQAEKAADGKQSCGGEQWSQAQMRYVTVPCAQR